MISHPNITSYMSGYILTRIGEICKYALLRTNSTMKKEKAVKFGDERLKTLTDKKILKTFFSISIITYAEV